MRAMASAETLFLFNVRFPRRPDSSNLDYHLTVLGPYEVRSSLRFGEESPGGPGLELAFVPLVAKAEVNRAREDNDSAPVVDASRTIDSKAIVTRVPGVTVSSGAA